MRKYLAVMLITGIVACNNTDQNSTGETDVIFSCNRVPLENVKAAGIDVELKDRKVQAIYDGYISLKDALVNTNFEASKEEAAALRKHLANYKGCENTAIFADKIAKAIDIKQQREEFTSLSADLIALFKHADVTKGSIFIQHCPMANNGDGGDWLAAESKIQNPYYGDEMMECGRILEEIKPVK